MVLNYWWLNQKQFPTNILPNSFFGKNVFIAIIHDNNVYVNGQNLFVPGESHIQITHQIKGQSDVQFIDKCIERNCSSRQMLETEYNEWLIKHRESHKKLINQSGRLFY